MHERVKPEPEPAGEAVPDLAATTVPPGHVVVLCDNRPEGRDSRLLGPIPVSALEGRVVALYWPATDWGRARRWP